MTSYRRGTSHSFVAVVECNSGLSNPSISTCKSEWKHISGFTWNQNFCSYNSKENVVGICSYQPGHEFQIGNTIVDCKCTDSSGNIDQCSFVVTVTVLDIRLAGSNSNYSGRVEILSDNGEWGTICDDYWDFKDALVVCRQLGFGPALAAHPAATFGAGNGPIYLDDVECIGKEESLFDCDSERVGSHNCVHNEDAGVECVNLDRTIRLVGGQDSSEGRVEIFVNGQWGTVCDNGWDLDDATVVCRQLGFNSVVQFYTRAFFGRGTGPVWMTNTQCTGNEADILACNHGQQNSCSHRRDASVACTGRVTIDDIRLSDGETILEGRVEVMIDGQWGTICDDNWSIEDGHVVCRELGFLAAIEITKRAAFLGEGQGEIWLNNVMCTGSEASLAGCRSDATGSPNCRHYKDAGVRCLTEATYSEIRLTGGMTSSEGRVEILLNGQWGTICDDSWDINAANVVCRELGYPAAESDSNSITFGEGSGPIWLDDVRCNGNELSLASCSHNDIATTDCGHHEDAGVKCEEEPTYSDIRLTGGMTSSEGRVEILFGGQWGTICDHSWDINAANVVCKELGYPAAESISMPTTFGRGRGPIWLDDVRCNGNELSLASCSHNVIGITDCGHHEDVGVDCQEEVYRQCCSEVVKMHEDIMVPLKKRQDEAKVLLSELKDLNEEYEKKKAELEESASAKRGWAIGLAFIPGLNAIATPLLLAGSESDTAEAVAKGLQCKLNEAATLVVSDTMIPALQNFIDGLDAVAGFFNVIENELTTFQGKGEKAMEDKKKLHYKMMNKKAAEIKGYCQAFYAMIPGVRSDFNAIPDAGTDQNYVDKWLAKKKEEIRKKYESGLTGQMRKMISQFSAKQAN